MKGGMTVVGNVTGTHFLEDIRVVVPYQVQVFLNPEQVLKSKDLQRAIQQKLIRVVDMSPLANEQSRRIRQLESELGASLDRERETRTHTVLEQEKNLLPVLNAARQIPTLLKALQEAMDELKARSSTEDALARIEARLASLSVVSASQVAVSAPTTNLDEMFIPAIQPMDDVRGDISTHTEVQDGSSLDEAANALRKLRQK